MKTIALSCFAVLRVFCVACFTCFLMMTGGGCVATSPQGRANDRPAALTRLSPNDRQLVLSGQIREGMDRDAVYIAWGQPSHIYSGSARGKPVEAWVYLKNPAGANTDFPLSESEFIRAGYIPPSAYIRGDPYFFYPYYPYFFSAGPLFGPLQARPQPEIPEKQVVFENGRVVKYHVLVNPR